MSRQRYADAFDAQTRRTEVAASSLLLSSLELGDRQVYEPYIRALLGTASHFYKVAHGGSTYCAVAALSLMARSRTMAKYYYYGPNQISNPRRFLLRTEPNIKFQTFFIRVGLLCRRGAVAHGKVAGSYLRLIDSCITQRKAQGPSGTCNESKEEAGGSTYCAVAALSLMARFFFFITLKPRVG